MTADSSEHLGATPLSEGGARFLVWAPRAPKVDLRLINGAEQVLPMERRDGGYFSVFVEDVRPDSRYLYRLNGVDDLPDPASRLQPEGVHGPSALVSDRFPWTDANWTRPAVERLTIRQINVGTHTREGTFDAVIPKLAEIRDLGITAIEVLQVNEFAGRRNTTDDSIFPGSVHAPYGGPVGLMNLVDAGHGHGMAVAIDLDFAVRDMGNYLEAYGPYFSDQNLTQWGRALNFDGPESTEVRRLFIETAVRFVEEFHVDALRFVSIQAIVDHSRRPLMEEVAAAVQAHGAGLLPPSRAPYQNERGSGGA